MELRDVLKAFLSGHFDEIVRKDPAQFELCLTELIHCNLVHKKRLIVGLIAAGVDCDAKNDRGLTPAEEALARDDGELVEAMLLAEAELYPIQQMVYRLVRRGSVPLLEIFLKLKQINESDKYTVLSLALEESSVKVVPLKQDMSNYCDKFLLAFFYSSADDTKWNDYQRRQNILNRFDIILQEISFLQGYGIECFTNIDNEYLQSLKIISENLFNVDALWHENGVSGLGPCRLWKRLYPQKIIWCFQVFIAVHMQNSFFKMCALLVDKAFVSVLLGMLESEIGAIKTGRCKVLIDGKALEEDLELLVAESDVYVRWKSKFPQQNLSREQIRRIRKEKRVPSITGQQQKYLKQLIVEKKSIEQIRSQWLELHPKVRLSKKAIQWAIEKARNPLTGRSKKPFSEKVSKKSHLALKMLHLRHDGLRTIYSLKTMLDGIEAVKDISLTRKVAREFGFDAFKRVSLLLGEYTKCTKDTDSTSFELVTLLNTCSVLATYRRQRDKLSHGLSLADVNLRIRRDNGELDTMMLQYCMCLQEDLNKSYETLRFVLVFLIYKACRSCLGRLVRFRSLEQCKSYCTMLACMMRAHKTFVDNLDSFYNFSKMYAQLEAVMKISELKSKHEVLKSIREDIRKAESEMHKYKVNRITRLELLLDHVRQLQTADCWDSVKMRTIVMLNITDSSLPNTILTLRKAMHKLISIMQEKQYSSETAIALTLLNSYLVNKEDRSQDLSKVHFHQFLPFQDERYTEDLLTALNIQLNSQQFYSFHYEMTQEVYDPLNDNHVGNVFAIEKKFKVMESLLKKRRIPYDVTLMDLLRKEDGRKFQILFEQMIQSLYDLSKCAARVNDEYKHARKLAILTGLLEVCQVLSHTEVFKANLQYLNTPEPLAVGRYLRNILAHGVMLVSSTFFFSEQIINLTIQVLYEQRHQIMNQGKFNRIPISGDNIQKYKRRKAFLCEQRIPFEVKLNKAIIQENKRFDIYGRFYLLRREAPSNWHNFLDILIYTHPNETIAYIKSVLEDNPRQQSVCYYLWSRLGYSELFGYKPLDIPESLVITYMRQILPGTAFETEMIHTLMLSRMNNILRYCMEMGKLADFIDLYNRYGSDIQLIDICSPSRLRFHRKMARIIPWNEVDSQNRTWVHLLCHVNNVEALQDALKTPAARRLLNKRDSAGRTPLNTAAFRGYFGIVEILLTNCDSLTIDVNTLSLVILGHRNNLLKYFVPSLESDTFENNLSSVVASIASSGNIEALRYFKSNLSVKAFRNMIPKEQASSVLCIAVSANVSKSIMGQFLSFPELSEAINEVDRDSNGTPLELDVKNGRFKCINLFLEHGAVVNLPVIRTAVQRNSFRWTKWLYRRAVQPLIDTELLGIIKNILYFKLDVRLLQYFVDRLSTMSIPCSYFFIAIQRRSLDHVRYLVSKFPDVLAQISHQSSSFHPFIDALNSIQIGDSFPQDKQLVMYLLKRYPNILERDDLLIQAVGCCDLDTVRFLINKNVPLDKEIQGSTALTQAAFLYLTRKRNYALLKLLLKHGASVRFLLKNKPEYFEHIYLMETILKETSFDPSEALPRVSFITNACASGSLRLVKLLVETYNCGITLLPVTACIAMDSYEVLRYLLTRFEDEALLMEAFRYAIQDGKVKAVRLILQHWPKKLDFKKSVSRYALLAHEWKKLHVFIFLHAIIERDCSV